MFSCSFGSLIRDGTAVRAKSPEHLQLRLGQFVLPQSEDPRQLCDAEQLLSHRLEPAHGLNEILGDLLLRFHIRRHAPCARFSERSVRGT